MKRVTLRDVAKEAGVSLATVDRVLNGRSKVRPDAAERVKNALDLLQFRGNVTPASLTDEQEYRFQFIIPRGPKNTFMVRLREEAEALGKRLAEQRIFLSFADYKELDDEELTHLLSQINPKICMGVAVVAIDTFAVREAIDALIQKGVGVVTLVSDVTPSRRLHCIGQNNVAAGRVAASLIGKFTAGLSGSVGIIAGAMTLCDQADRRVGFEQVITREYPHLRVLPVREGRDDSSITVTVARELLANNPDLVGLYNIGAGNRGLINAIEESGRKSEVVVVAHELTEHARRALIAGTFDAIINQNLLHEIEYAVQTLKAFSDSDAGFIAPSVSIDIFVRDNLP